MIKKTTLGLKCLEVPLLVFIRNPLLGVIKPRFNSSHSQAFTKLRKMKFSSNFYSCCNYMDQCDNNLLQCWHERCGGGPRVVEKKRYRAIGLLRWACFPFYCFALRSTSDPEKNVIEILGNDRDKVSLFQDRFAGFS